MNVKELKDKARSLGADLVGIAPKSRWEHLPAGENPLAIMPECKSVIVLGRKIVRGAFRGIEEGTNFGSTYGCYGKGWHEYLFFSRVVFNLSLEIEKTGAEAAPMMGGTPEMQDGVKNTVVDAKKMAHLAGLGSVGKGGFFLTKAYGLRQRLAFILTDAEFPGDEIVDVTLCDGCTACMDACPIGGFGTDGSLKMNVCHVCQNGKSANGPHSFEPEDRLASACGRACLVATEGKIDETFKQPFRKRAIWTRDLDGTPTVTPLNNEGGR